MVSELLSTMRHTKVSQGFDVKLIKLTQRQYNELRQEMLSNMRYHGVVVDGEVPSLNGATIEVV